MATCRGVRRCLWHATDQTTTVALTREWRDYNRGPLIPDPAATPLGWSVPGAKPVSHYVVVGADRRPYWLCMGEGHYYFGRHFEEPQGYGCRDCRKILELMQCSV